MKSYQLLLALVVIVHVQCSLLDDWHARIYNIAEKFYMDRQVQDQVCKEMLTLELRIAALAHTREQILCIQAAQKPHLRGYSSSDLCSVVRKQCFDESLFCGYGIFLYSVAQYENLLEKFLVDRGVDVTGLSSMEELRNSIIDLLKIEQLTLFNAGYDVHFGPEYLLAWAAWCGSLEIILLLVEKGADIVRSGHVAIEAAVASLDGIPEKMREEKFKILHYLIYKGAQVSRTAYELAQKNCPKSDKISTLLLQHLSVQSACSIM